MPTTGAARYEASVSVKEDSTVSDAYFTVSSDLDILDGTALWLEVALRGRPC
jgi:hypothetical protein